MASDTMIDYRAYPHIFESIVSSCDFPSLLALRPVNREICAVIDTRLAKHLVLVPGKNVRTPIGLHPALNEQKLRFRITPRLPTSDIVKNLCVVDWAIPARDSILDTWLFSNLCGQRHRGELPVVRIWNQSGSWKRARRQQVAKIMDRVKTLIVFSWGPRTSLGQPSASGTMPMTRLPQPPHAQQRKIIVHVDPSCPAISSVLAMRDFTHGVLVLHDIAPRISNFLNRAEHIFRQLLRTMFTHFLSGTRHRSLIVVNIEGVPPVLSMPFGSVNTVGTNVEDIVASCLSEMGERKVRSPTYMSREEYRLSLGDHTMWNLEMDDSYTLCT